MCAVVGDAYINIIAKTEGFESSLTKGTSGGLSKVEQDAEATGSRSGKKLAGGLSGALSGAANMFGLGFLTPVTEGVDRAGEHFDKASTKSAGFRGQLQSLGGGVALGAAVGVAAVGYEAIDAAGKFDAATGKIAASAGISTDAAKKIGAAFLTTGGQTTVTAQEMAGAYANVAGQLGATAGHALSAKDALSVMKAAGDAAEATGVDLNTATGALAKTMQAFGIGAKGASAASDVLSNVSHDTGTNIDALATQLGKLHTSLGANAPSLQQSSALLDDFAKHGVTGRGAMTAMTATLQAMVTPTDKQKAALDSMGVSLTDANGKFIGIGPAMDLLKQHMGANASASDQAAMSTLFHGKTLGQLTPLLQEGAAGFDKNTAAVTKAGSAHEAAEKASRNLHGQMEKLKGAVMDQVTQWGEKLMPVLLKVGSVLATMGEWVMQHKIVLAALGVVVGTVLVAAFVSWAASAAAAAVATVAATWPILLIIAAIGLVVAAVLYFSKHWRAVWDEVKAVVKDVIDWIVHAWDTAVAFFTKLPGRIVAALADFGKMLLKWITDAWNTFVHWVLAAFDIYVNYWVLLPLRIIQVVLRFGADLLHWIMTAWNAMVGWVLAAIEAWIGWWTGLPGRIIAGLENLGSMLLGWISAAWGMVTSGLSTAWDTTASFIGSIPGKVLGFLGNAGSLLLQWGKDLITGLITGIGSMAGALASGFKSLFDSLPGVGLLKKLPGLSWLAEGGLITQPTLAVVGESGPELVLPLNKLQAFLNPVGNVPASISSGLTAANLTGPPTTGPSTTGAGPVNIYVNNEVTLSADVSQTTIADIERMLQSNNRDLAQRLGALR